MSTMSSDEAYAAVIRQAAHDAVRALLAAPPDSVAGSRQPARGDRLAGGRDGAAAVSDLAEELAVDLAEAFDALAAAEGRSALAVLDGWFHDVPAPLLGRHPPASPTRGAAAAPEPPPRWTRRDRARRRPRRWPATPDGHRAPAEPRRRGAGDRAGRIGSCARRPGGTASSSPRSASSCASSPSSSQQTSTRHTDLAAAVSEDLAPRVGALQQVVTERVGRLRGDVDVLLTERKSGTRPRTRRSTGPR